VEAGEAMRRSLVPTGGGQRGQRDTVHTGEALGSLTHGPWPPAGGRERGAVWGAWAGLKKEEAWAESEGT
jgi:hypothetical protein